MVPFAVDLDDVDPDRRERFGGKACGLARLLRAGARVPGGFVLPVGTAPPDAWSESERSRFRRALAPLLAAGPVAVRSSARAEDGAEHSWAGIFESVLDVGDVEAATEAVARCLASGASERTRSYAEGGGADVGVVVQRQVPARAAGVAFTVDPTGRDRAVVIEAVAGLGEALVSGHAAPSAWRVHLAGDGRLEAELERAGDAAALGPDEAVDLAREARSLAGALGEPLDLEWAVDGEGALWWLQARPVTASAAPPPLPRVQPGCRGADDGPIRVWTNLNVRETMPDPLAPLAWSLWRDRLVPAIGRLSLDFGDASAARHLGVTDLVDGRIYWNVNAVGGVPGFAAILERALDVLDGTAHGALAGLRARGVRPRRRYPASRLAVARAWLRAQRRGLPALVRGLRPEQSLRALEAFGASMIERERQPLAGRSDASLTLELEEITSFDFMEVSRLFASLTWSLVAFALARHIFRDHPEAQAQLAVGIAHNPTTRMSIELDALAEAARPLAPAFLGSDSAEALFSELAGSPEGRAWSARFERFLDWNGQRCPGEFDVTVPRWSDEPGMLLELVRATLREPPKEGVRARMEALAAERRASVARAVAASPARRRPALRWAARFAERHLPLREAGKHYLLFVLQRVRRLALELGARWTARGLLPEPEAVFLLELAELGDVARGALRGEALARRLTRARRELDGHAASRPAPFVRSDGVPVRTEADAGGLTADGTLCGTGISTGIAEGTVRILDTPDPSALQRGDILVVHLADPGWTPLFGRAGGLVMEVGGLMCHAAVVARELGVPAVFGVTGAREVLRDGDRVRVDAEAGRVTRL